MTRSTFEIMIRKGEAIESERCVHYAKTGLAVWAQGRDVDACAYVLICEAFMKKVKKDEYDKLTEEDITNIKDSVDTSECLTITWEYKNEVTRSGIVSTPLLKDTGTIELDYENIVDDYDDKSQAEGRAVHLL